MARSFGLLKRLPLVGEDGDRAVLLGARDAPLAAGVRAFAGHEPALRIELESVGAAAGLAMLGGRHGLGVELHDAVADVAEVDAVIRSVGGSFGELTVAPEFFELGARRGERIAGVCGGGGEEDGDQGEQATHEMESSALNPRPRPGLHMGRLCLPWPIPARRSLAACGPRRSLGRVELN
jgi:hypothetical protein